MHTSPPDDFPFAGANAAKAITVDVEEAAKSFLAVCLSDGSFVPSACGIATAGISALDKTLTIKLTTSATLKVGSELVLLETNSALVSQADARTAFSGSATPCAGSGGDLLSAAGSAQPPSFDATLSSDPSGRAAWVDVQWAVDVSSGPTAGHRVLQAAVNRTNSIAGPNNRLVLSVTASEVADLPEASYGLQVTLTSWLGASATKVLTFARAASAAAAPSIRIAGQASQTFLLSSGLRLSAEADNECDESAASGTVTVTAVGAAPMAQLAGASGDVPDDAVLVLNATGSLDPDTTRDLQQLSFAWDCRQVQRREDAPAPCFLGADQGDTTTSPGVWRLPPSLLTHGPLHAITVTVIKAVARGAAPLVHTASVSFRVRPASEPFPRGALTRQCSAAECQRAHGTNKDLVVMLVLAPEYRNATATWSCDEVPSLSSLVPRSAANDANTPNGTFVLTVPAASLPANRANLTIAAALLFKGVAGLATVTVPLNNPPACSLGSGTDPSACLNAELTSDTFPKAVAVLRTQGWADDLDSQLTYEFGVRTAAADHAHQVGASPSAPIVGLPQGSVTLYACASDSQGSRACGTANVTVKPPGTGFDAAAEMRAANLSNLSSKGLAKTLQAAAQVSLLSAYIASSAGSGGAAGRPLMRSGGGGPTASSKASDAEAELASTTAVLLVNAILGSSNLQDTQQDTIEN
ncbi:hypothetical protein GPECTOR_6g598 [Gonium pectorale]|uniref:PKD/REJ-like domain-containing protein n=1 Tax=Gonium pectorale TaxID=33097 RepID=A0A150GV21_GONPE|nr:hypothetical protein GPECTOR_6g598 [Gonium pectorale]|eukprot:KXZ53681.1 hypothetical protein GPECTOR_6g598 [Gonium pectorale]